MVSRSQLEANRANAKHSTGPKTEFGKDRSKMNAVKHGLAAAGIVVLDEDPAEFEALRSDLKANFEPIGLLQQELVDRIAGLLWRQRRIPLLEAALIRDEMEKVEVSKSEGRGIVEKLKAELIATRARMQLARMQSAVDHDVGTDDDKPRADDDEAARAAHDEPARADPDEAASAQAASPEAQRKRIDRVLALIALRNSFGHLSRYEASLMTGLTRTVALLRLLQTSRIQPGDSERVLINSIPIPTRARST